MKILNEEVILKTKHINQRIDRKLYIPCYFKEKYFLSLLWFIISLQYAKS